MPHKSKITSPMTIKEFFKKVCSKSIIGNMLAMLLLTVLLIVGDSSFLVIYTHHGQEVTVPDLRGKSYDVAVAELNDMGLKAEVRDTGYVRTLPPNSVLDQSIRPGEKVKAGRIIEFTINAASARAVAIPDIADNCSLREAEAKLRVMGFKLTAPKYVTGDKDWVYGIEVNGRNVVKGQRVSVDVPLTLVVGDGNVQDEYNGNDSLDYVINGPSEEELKAMRSLNENNDYDSIHISE